MSFADAFHEVAVLVLAAAAIGALAVRLHQPLIVAFIVVGVLAGPSALDVIQAGDEIHLLAELGIALVLFVVGLKLDVRVIRDTGRVALITGAVQSGSWPRRLRLGADARLEVVTGAYVAMALVFLSTIIVVSSCRIAARSTSCTGDRRRRSHCGDLVVIGAIIALTAIGAATTAGRVAGRLGGR